MHEYVLSGGEIIKLRHYIEQKHNYPAPQKRASILANAVHRIIESRLPSFPPEVKKQIRMNLLLEHSESLTIHVDNVFQQCMSLDLNKEELLLPLVSWVSKQSDDPLPEEQVRSVILKTYKKSKSVTSLQALVQEAAQAHVKTQVKAQTRKLSLTSYLRTAIPAAVTLAAIFLFILIWQIQSPASQVLQHGAAVHMPVSEIPPASLAPAASSGIPQQLRYTPVDTNRLREYLQSKNSFLADDPYMNAIIQAGEQYDVHPLLLFAITGQEQALVPKDHRTAEEIVNNPFNVYGSWERYNTTIDESAKIAAKTVANVSSRRPEDSHPIQWLNQTYAEDPNWWTGVTWFFDTMLREVSDDSFEWSS